MFIHYVYTLCLYTMFIHYVYTLCLYTISIESIDSILQQLCSTSSILQQFCSNKFDTSKRELEQVSILQKVSSLTALEYTYII